MDSKIELTRFDGDSRELPPTLRHCWPLRIEAKGTNMPSEIFVYHAAPDDPNAMDPIAGDRFEAIASVPQIFELPKTGPGYDPRGGFIPYYRSATLELICRSAEEAVSIWEDVKKEVTILEQNYNAAFRLRGIERATISQGIIQTTTFDVNPPIIYQISYRPAGTATLSGSTQGIQSPNPNLPGWLPADNAPTDWAKPPGAFLYYNMAQDPGLAAIWPPQEPYSGNILLRNGIEMPYGTVFVFTAETIWWQKFVPATLPIYNRIGSAQDGNAPWPMDYVSPSNPGAVAPIIQIKLFK